MTGNPPWPGSFSTSTTNSPPDFGRSKLPEPDTPAVTYDSEIGAAGIRQGVLVGACDVLLFPIGPRYLLSIGKSAEVLDLPPRAVRLSNRLQLINATNQVFHHPDDDFLSEIEAWRNDASV